MNDITAFEVSWIHNIRITKIFKNNNLVTVKQHVKLDDAFILISEEHRTHHENGRIKELWTFDGRYYKFDVDGLLIGMFEPR